MGDYQRVVVIFIANLQSHRVDHVPHSQLQESLQFPQKSSRNQEEEEKELEIETLSFNRRCTKMSHHTGRSFRRIKHGNLHQSWTRNIYNDRICK